MNEFENYTMDIFNEYLIKRKFTVKEYLIVIFTSCLTLIIAGGLFYLSAIFAQNIFINEISILLMIAICYFGYVIISRQNVEYEYSLTNSFFDVDKIIFKRRRVNLVQFDLKSAYEMGKFDFKKKKNESSQIKTIYAGNMDDSAYYLICDDKKIGKVRLIFNPDEKMKNIMKMYLKQKFYD